ncbi:hypothetical protein BV898_02355 [Hypsibius exemplaris]|uniref:Receptor ligand binding region domain-containing protein n=1 Tax=Hypsibius exemplaris TaxID=2072580 RepID=A0A1W0X898_HYPEX|nr:hypothetical protein BV898_02355 [Hypsibius exemplaris]
MLLYLFTLYDTSDETSTGQYEKQFDIQSDNWSANSTMKLRLVLMIVGDGSSTLGYSIMAPAYEVAIRTIRRKYPLIFRQISIARTVSATAPGRVPNLLTWSSMPFSAMVDAVLQFVLRYSWTEVNLLCDDNRDQSPTIEVICGLISAFARIKAKTTNFLVRHFDSSVPGTFRRALSEGRRQSAINILASYTSVYPSMLIDAAELSMTTGEYVFLILSVSPYTQAQEMQWFDSSDEFQKNLLIHVLPFVFALDFDDVNWTAVADEIEEMRVISLDQFNWTIKVDQQHDRIRLAAYESVLVLAEVINNTWRNLINATADSFVRSFSRRRTYLSARTVDTSPTSTRICNLQFRQFRLANRSMEVVLLFDHAQGSLNPPNISTAHRRPTIEWSGQPFPPRSRPTCRDLFGSHCSRNDYIATAATASVLSVLGAIAAVSVAFFVQRRCRPALTGQEWWLLGDPIGVPILHRSIYNFHYF